MPAADPGGRGSDTPFRDERRLNGSVRSRGHGSRKRHVAACAAGCVPTGMPSVLLPCPRSTFHFCRQQRYSVFSGGSARGDGNPQPHPQQAGAGPAHADGSLPRSAQGGCGCHRQDGCGGHAGLSGAWRLLRAMGECCLLLTRPA